MKKMYVKPLAANVTFVVNENIATSLPKDPTESLPGSLPYSNNWENCNELYRGFETGLKPGEKNAIKVLEHIGALYGKDIYFQIRDEILAEILGQE
jgi:hypothetical protein